MKILQLNSLKHAASCSQQCEHIHGIQIMIVHTTFCVLNRIYFITQVISKHEMILTATKKNGRIGWKSTHCTKPFDLLNGTCDRRFDN